jgi:anoctamin-10
MLLAIDSPKVKDHLPFSIQTWLTILDKEQGIEQFKKLIRVLAETGLTTEVRRGDETSLLVFVKAADENIFAQVVYRSRIKDWLHGVRQMQPTSNPADTLAAEPLTDAERYRQIHHMICCSTEEGGAGITPKYGEWKNVEAVFPLHDHVKNKKWLTDFSRKTFLSAEDLDEIRNTVGEKASIPSNQTLLAPLTLIRLAIIMPSFNHISHS